MAFLEHVCDSKIAWYFSFALELEDIERVTPVNLNFVRGIFLRKKIFLDFVSFHPQKIQALHLRKPIYASVFHRSLLIESREMEK